MEIQVSRNENSFQTNAYSRRVIPIILIPAWSQTNAPLQNKYTKKQTKALLVHATLSEDA